MDRPYIFCHMETSLDGKITGPFMQAADDNYQGDGDLFYHIAFDDDGYYHPQSWLSGRTTTDDNFTHYAQPQLDENAAPVPAGDFIPDTDAPMYYVSIDPHGKLAWTTNQMTFMATTARVLEVLTTQASSAYRAFLRQLDIPYIIAGDTELDAPLAMKKLKDLFHMETVMLGGGGVLNWSFIQQGLCDELSLVLSNAADGSTDTPTLFSAVPGLSSTTPRTFTLKNVEAHDNFVWLRYLIDPKK